MSISDLADMSMSDEVGVGRSDESDGEVDVTLGLLMARWMRRFGFRWRGGWDTSASDAELNGTLRFPIGTWMGSFNDFIQSTLELVHPHAK